METTTGPEDGPRDDYPADPYRATRWTLPPATCGSWYLSPPPKQKLYWVGRPEDADAAIEPMQPLIDALRGFRAIVKHREVYRDGNYPPMENNEYAKGGRVYFVAELADCGRYGVLTSDRALHWYEDCGAPRLEPEVSQRLIEATQNAVTQGDEVPARKPRRTLPKKAIRKNEPEPPRPPRRTLVIVRRS
jgi:hypothetical protein